jgi:ABC-type glycerol-3-phosphate transport system permease component
VVTLSHGPSTVRGPERDENDGVWEEADLKAILDSFGQSGEMQWDIIIAAMVITTVPMIVVFFLGQRYFVQGIATSGRKG